MTEGDALKAAQATAKKLNDQAAALREGKLPFEVMSMIAYFISYARFIEMLEHSVVG